MLFNHLHNQLLINYCLFYFDHTQLEVKSVQILQPYNMSKLN